MSDLLDLLKDTEEAPELEELQVIQADSQLHLAIQAIALAYAKRGELQKASELAHELVGALRREVLEDIGGTAVKSHLETEARQWARDFENPNERAYALLGIASAISAGQNKVATIH